MGLSREGAVASVVLLAMASPAMASGPYYFHKAGVERESFVADYMECADLARGVRVQGYTVYSNNIYAMAAGSFFAGFFKASERRMKINNVLRTCMADKGYRRVEASPDTRKELGKLKSEERIDRLFALAAASEVEGRVLPQ